MKLNSSKGPVYIDDRKVIEGKVQEFPYPSEFRKESKEFISTVQQTIVPSDVWSLDINIFPIFEYGPSKYISGCDKRYWKFVDLFYKELLKLGHDVPELFVNYSCRSPFQQGYIGAMHKLDFSIFEPINRVEKRLNAIIVKFFKCDDLLIRAKKTTSPGLFLCKGEWRKPSQFAYGNALTYAIPPALRRDYCKFKREMVEGLFDSENLDGFFTPLSSNNFIKKIHNGQISVCCPAKRTNKPDTPKFSSDGSWTQKHREMYMYEPERYKVFTLHTENYAKELESFYGVNMPIIRNRRVNSSYFKGGIFPQVLAQMLLFCREHGPHGFLNDWQHNESYEHFLSTTEGTFLFYESDTKQCDSVISANLDHMLACDPWSSVISMNSVSLLNIHSPKAFYFGRLLASGVGRTTQLNVSAGVRKLVMKIYILITGDKVWKGTVNVSFLTEVAEVVEFYFTGFDYQGNSVESDYMTFKYQGCTYYVWTHLPTDDCAFVMRSRYTMHVDCLKEYDDIYMEESNFSPDEYVTFGCKVDRNGIESHSPSRLTKIFQFENGGYYQKDAFSTFCKVIINPFTKDIFQKCYRDVFGINDVWSVILYQAGELMAHLKAYGIPLDQTLDPYSPSFESIKNTLIKARPDLVSLDPVNANDKLEPDLFYNIVKSIKGEVHEQVS